MLAKRENDVDKFLTNNNKIRDPIVFDTLIKMFQREAMNDSSYLAKKILSNLEKTKLAVNRGHRFAGFSVLKSYDIPSVLIEIGFLSNKQEEKKMIRDRNAKIYKNFLSKFKPKKISFDEGKIILFPLKNFCEINLNYLSKNPYAWTKRVFK